MINQIMRNRYPVSKTIRFELIPYGMASEQVEDFRKEAATLIQADLDRAKAYPNVKVVLDDYYRDYLDNVLPLISLQPDDYTQAYNLFILWKKDLKNKPNRDNYLKAEKELRKTIAKDLSAFAEEYQLNKFSKIFSRKEGTIYPWLKNRYKNGLIDEEEYFNQKNSLELFDEFTGYFSKYQENRNNLFADGKASSISNRSIDQNMRFYFQNCIAYQNIKDKYPDLTEQLKQYSQYFQPEYYGKFLTQEGINDYNLQVGRARGSDDIPGINQRINLFRQKNKITSRDLPIMAHLFKQILSKQDKFEIDEITNDEELFERLREVLPIANRQVKRIAEYTREYINPSTAPGIFINPKSISELSHSVFGVWDLLQNAIDTRKARSLTELELASSSLINQIELNERPARNSIIAWFNSFDETSLQTAIEKMDFLDSVNALDLDRSMPSLKNPDGGEGYQQISKIKAALDEIQTAIHRFKPLILEEDGVNQENLDMDFYINLTEIYSDLEQFTKPYNVIRNYLTKKPYKTDKIKINFNKPTFLKGWDINKIEDNFNVFFEKDGLFYLGFLLPHAKKLFSNTNKIHYECTNEIPHFRLMQYKQVSGSNKMFSKVFFSKKELERYKPSEEILKLRDTKEHTPGGNNPEAKNKWLRFMIDSVAKHPEWNEYFDFHFKQPEEYSTIMEFFDDADAQMYSMGYINVSDTYIHSAIADGKMYMFQLHTKDFSPASKGTPNLHTLIWRGLFSEENLKNLKNFDQPMIKLNGEAELFLREKSISVKNPTHPANEPIPRKQINSENGTSQFHYGIVKDRRFTKDKFFLHIPITLNFRMPKVSNDSFNRNVNLAVLEDPSVHIIGVDRGERNLITFVVINRKGEIVEQGSLNKIGNDFPVDYQKLLDHKEKERDQARKSWGTIEQIKDLKRGYISGAVYKLTRLIEKYNAIVILENLNIGFKRSRQKIEKQVYQNFEKGLIQKLNYLTFKERKNDEPGGILQGYQLSFPFESFEKIRNQTGILYYVPASYTSNICPRTGYINQGFYRYDNLSNAKAYLASFNSIRYNATEDYFEFDVDFKKIRNKQAIGRTTWILCSAGSERVSYSKKEGYKIHDATQELKGFFARNSVSFESQKDLIPAILQIDSAGEIKHLISIIQLIMQLRNTTPGTESENDYILSPIKDSEGQFYDSRSPKHDKNGLPVEPTDADTNGAYHIALKGLQMISHIDESGRLGTVNNQSLLSEFLSLSQHS